MSSPIYDLKPSRQTPISERTSSKVMESDSSVTAMEIYKELETLISFQLDRFQNTRTYSIPVTVQPLIFSAVPSAELIYFFDTEGKVFTALKMVFQIKGKAHVPPPDTPVDWLLDGNRAESTVIASNGQSSSSSFRVGMDVMPGPLSVFVSTPVTVTKSAFWVAVNIPAELFEKIEKSSTVELRIMGTEYRLSGENSAPVAEYAVALRAFAEKTFYSAAPLAMRLREERRKQKTRHLLVVCIVLSIVAAVCALGYFSVSKQATFADARESPSPSESVNATPSPKPARRKR